ncbi:hypothetical protein ARTHRO9V_280105 [Arthrobacter sp. 9V]|nr:hypothetical protein ARTHRO9V_280105 [Arthrobacter sp. 9V]
MLRQLDKLSLPKGVMNPYDALGFIRDIDGP